MVDSRAEVSGEFKVVGSTPQGQWVHSVTPEQLVSLYFLLISFLPDSCSIFLYIDFQRNHWLLTNVLGKYALPGTLVIILCQHKALQNYQSSPNLWRNWYAGV